MNIVIIGNGAAGALTAGHLRKALPEANIHIISDENYCFYSRPRIIDYLTGTIEKEKLIIRKEDWYKKNQIELYLEQKVISINPSEKCVILEDTRCFHYDTLVIAAGAHSFLPNFNCTTEGIFTLRTIDDADCIINYSKGRKKASVIGGGLLGIEAGHSLLNRGLEVEIIECFDRLLPRQLDPESASILQGQLEQKGLQFRLGMQTQKIVPDEKGFDILFKDGQKTATELILVSAGIRPNLSIIKDSGIESNKGITVNEYLQTNYEDIYACGDIAEFNGTIYGIWPAANEQASVVAKNIAGMKQVYKGTVMSTKLKVAGINLVSIGEVSEENGAVGQSSGDGSDFKKLFFRDDKLTGAILIGDTKAFTSYQRAILEGADRKVVENMGVKSA
ncbi:FAD-dependent oxidoreductase [Chitinispirillales bacterium ANBcel5]|uniref:NAD(P)/FAD-dependent oxidoreductase n=1 Tax=Cellulosispirillum alkaliphilum TaxID=3039283 RepID=UPI002A570CDB|nr:FAD-dependent oxidoreductase [Chitinispirillales bacterium ANBcel5]